MEQSLCGSWRFHLGEAADAGMMGYDDRGWRQVTVPHDWAVEHPFDTAHASGTGYLPGGIGWYRKSFQLSPEVEGQRATVTFDGVYNHARVWINSHYLGEHAYGYTAFTMDLTPFVRPGEECAVGSGGSQPCGGFTLVYRQRHLPPCDPEGYPTL